ncbi:MAG: hypothetical protein HY823_09980 [Acidobacteria bacterium]|nr:hypothetical protein [Acidobacteriota bacterium]
MKRILASSLAAGLTLLGVQPQEKTSVPPPPPGERGEPDHGQIIQAFAKQGIRVNGAEAAGIRPNVLLALREARTHGLGNSKVDFAAVEIARDLGLDAGPGSNTVKNIVAAVGWLAGQGGPRPQPPPPQPPPEWSRYFDETTNLWRQGDFMSLLNEKAFHPVKISWEDIGRHQGSVWGDRISDVGIWVRKDEGDPASARLALSVRRDSNFRDKVLMVPADKIKVHQRQGGRTVEKTLPERLRELGLASQARDRNVIVSNQFAVVPVPARGMEGAWPQGVPPRAAFTFSIFPYGSTNFVITDVIEGSSEALVGPGTHQLLYANVEGQKAPFTASRAEDRQDLLRLERELKAQGMDVDVQRYYLIQVPIRKGAGGIQLANLGTPPMARAFAEANVMAVASAGAGAGQPVPAPPASAPLKKDDAAKAAREREGFSRVAIGHGEAEGPYSPGSGWRGQRAEEPIRVTVVYFVTPVGKVTRRDMERFSAAFAQWDKEAIWGGSFVTKESGM